MIDDPRVTSLVRDALIALMTSRRIKSQSAFARSVKLSNGYVCDVLACRRNLSPRTVARIAEVYALTRKQTADLHHRAAQVAGWQLPPLPADQQVHVFAPAPRPKPPPKPVKPLPKAKRKVVVVHAGKKSPPARVLAATVAKPVVVSMDKPRRPGGFVLPSLEDLTNDIERESM